ncbi:MAG: extracellular solute-binding protein [Pseudomonadota bacterium]
MMSPLSRLRTLALLVCFAALASCKPAGPGANAQTTISAFVWAPEWQEEMRQIAAAFMQQNPDVRVDLQFMTGNSVEQNIKPRVASQDLPDIMSVNPNPFTAEMAAQGLLADVGNTHAWNNMVDSLRADWTTRTGRRYGISGGVAATLMYYNKDMFEKAGIKALPTTFDEFLAVCERLKRAGFTPIMWNGGFPNTLGNGPFSFGFANSVVATTPDWKSRLADGSLNLDTLEIAEIFGRIKVVADRGYVQANYMNTNYEEGMRLFAEGKTAMAFHGTWASGVLMKGKDVRAGVFMPPWNANGRPTIPVIGSETGWAVCETRNKAAALRFLEFISGAGFTIQQNKRQNISPFKEAPGKMISDPQIVAYIDEVSNAPVTGSPYYAFLPADTIEMLHPLIQDVLFGKVTPRQAAHLFDASVKEAANKHAK